MTPEEINAVETELAGKVICPRCGATLDTYHLDCTARLDDRCPGFEAIDEVARNAAEPRP